MNGNSCDPGTDAPGCGSVLVFVAVVIVLFFGLVSDRWEVGLALAVVFLIVIGGPTLLIKGISQRNRSTLRKFPASVKKIPPAPTKAARLKQAAVEYKEARAMIASLELDEDEKEVLRGQAEEKYLQRIGELIG